MSELLDSRPLEGKRVLITGATGSLGRKLVNRILLGDVGRPAKVIAFSRDEAKQHDMRLEYKHLWSATDEVIYHNFEELLQFRIGDVRDFHSIAPALREVDIVFHAAALKQVPTCEYFPYEAVKTNIGGAENIVRAVEELNLGVESIIGISTDKACKPVNVMGMSKAIQERILIEANIRCPQTRTACVRYGNVLTSRGSVVPLFLAQIEAGGPITVTTPEMTRFLLTLDESVEIVLSALIKARPGETFVPKVASARMEDVARVLAGEREIPFVYSGIRPGEKIHEILISEEEIHRTVDGPSGYYRILPMLPELVSEEIPHRPLRTEYSSAHAVMTPQELGDYLAERLPSVVPVGNRTP